MRCDLIFSDALAEMQRQALGQAAGVDEDQRGTMLHGQLGEAVVDFAPTSRCWRRGSSSDGGISTARSSVRRWPMLTMKAVSPAEAGSSMFEGWLYAARKGCST